MPCHATLDTRICSFVYDGISLSRDMSRTTPWAKLVNCGFVAVPDFPLWPPLLSSSSIQVNSISVASGFSSIELFFWLLTQSCFNEIGNIKNKDRSSVLVVQADCDKPAGISGSCMPILHTVKRSHRCGIVIICVAWVSRCTLLAAWIIFWLTRPIF